MYRFKNLVVGMTVGAKDRAKIQYAGLVSWLALSETITFTHVLSTDEFIKSGKSQQLAIEECKSVMEAVVQRYYDGRPETKLSYEVLPESPLIEIELLRHFKEKEADLVVLGRIRGEFTAEATLPVKLSRKAPGSVLFVPEEAAPHRKRPNEINLLVPVDFSENARDAMELALDFAAAHEIPSIRCVHVYDVPLGYYKRGKSYEEFSVIMAKNAENRCREFLGELNLKGVFVQPLMVRLEKKVFEIIDSMVRAHGIDLIIIGSHHKKRAARLLLNSVTEQLIRKAPAPLLAVRRMGKGMSFLEALLRL